MYVHWCKYTKVYQEGAACLVTWSSLEGTHIYLWIYFNFKHIYLYVATYEVIYIIFYSSITSVAISI